MTARVVLLSKDRDLKKIIEDELKQEPDFSVAEAQDLAGVVFLMSKSTPNFLFIDTETQRVTDTYIKDLLDANELRVVMIGSINSAGLARAGVKDFLQRPLMDNSFSVNVFLRSVIRILYEEPVPAPQIASPYKDMATGVDENSKVIAIAASTGGTEALPAVLQDLPADLPPILIVQHMPSTFTRQFADRLNKLSKINVKEAADGDFLKKGLALLAPGDLHMKLCKRFGKLAVECVMGEKVQCVRPSADVLFESMQCIKGRNVVGVILTGMGADGARGLRDLKQRGAVVISQDQGSSIVYGMPKAAYELGAVDFQLPLHKISDKIVELARQI